jgi:hypothetical protein
MTRRQPRFGRIAAVVASAWISACASTYTLSSAAVGFRATLDDSHARAVVGAALKPFSSGHPGAYLASAVPAFAAPPDEVKLAGTNVEFLVSGPTDVIGRTLNDECVGPSGALENENDGAFPLTAQKPTVCHGNVDLRNLWRIRVVESEGEDFTLPGYNVWIQESSTRYVIVNIPGSALNELMAALTFYSPNAKLMEGVGF